MKDLLNRLFPRDEEVVGRSSKFVERGLEALRLVRDDHAVAMGSVRRVPSHFELRVSPEHFEALQGMDALRDMAFFFKDELMKDLAPQKMRTFGDHTVRVGIAPDPALGTNELYAVILNPERKSATDRRPEGPTAPAGPDATRILGIEPEPPIEDQAPTTALGDVRKQQEWGWNLTIRFPDGHTHDERLDHNRWIVGRRGSTGTLPPGTRKLDLDLPTTVSREQLAVELDADTALLRRIGKASVGFKDGTTLAENESRRIELGEAFFVEGVEMKIVGR